MNYLDHIATDPHIAGGESVLKGTRVASTIRAHRRKRRNRV